MTNETLIYENDHYQVVLGKPEITKDSDLIYKIVNRVYNISEMETTMLPRALFEADDFSKMLQQHNTAIPGEGAH